MKQINQYKFKKTVCSIIFRKKLFVLAHLLLTETVLNAQGHMREVPIRNSYNYKDLSKYTPNVITQKGSTSVAWATAYYAYATQLAAAYEITNPNEIKKLALSPMYAQKQLSDNCEQGMTIHSIAKIITEKGALQFDTYLNEFSCENKLTPLFNYLASTNRPIKDYALLFNRSDTTKVQNTIKQIANFNSPVIVGIEIDSDFINFKEFQDFYRPNSSLNANKKYHAVTVIGFDSNNKAFKIINSMGREWGQNGFCLIKFDDFEKIAQTGVVLILPGDKQENFYKGEK